MMFRAVKKRAILVSETDVEVSICGATAEFDAKMLNNAKSPFGRVAIQKTVAERRTVKMPCHLNCPLARRATNLESIR